MEELATRTPGAGAQFMTNQNKARGDGTDLCCLVNPYRRHRNCSYAFCIAHYWNESRARAGLGPLQDVANTLDGKCIRCGKDASTEAEWEYVVEES